MKEVWERWEPVEDFPETIYLESLVDGKNGLTLIFETEDSNTKITINFASHVLSYKNTDEGDIFETWRNLSKNYGDEFYAKWALFKVRKSSYLKWFLGGTPGKWSEKDIEHFVFKTPADVVEVLSNYSPDIDTQV